MIPVAEMNKRRRVRVDFATRILIDFDHSGIQLTGDSRNLSTKGIYISTTENVPLNATCRVQVFLTGTIAPHSLTMAGTVVRKESEGVAILFNSIELDSYIELKHIVRYNTENPDEVV
ncbi:MAG: PilZ domain-containing protein [Desulfobacterales bacterium]|jgi:hypothetical protein|nr:PilZ domain-containing protein [Desulfobacterales bacterium]